MGIVYTRGKSKTKFICEQLPLFDDTKASMFLLFLLQKFPHLSSIRKGVPQCSENISTLLEARLIDLCALLCLFMKNSSFTNEKQSFLFSCGLMGKWLQVCRHFDK